MDDKPVVQVLVERLREQDRKIEELTAANLRLSRRVSSENARANRFEIGLGAAVRSLRATQSRMETRRKAEKRRNPHTIGVNRCIKSKGETKRVKKQIIPNHERVPLVVEKRPVAFGNAGRRR